MQPEPDRLLSLPEHRRLLEHFVRKRPDLAQDAAMDLEDGVSHVRDTACKRLRRAVAVLVAPRVPAFLGLLGIARSVGRERVLDDAEEAVLGPEHVLEDLADRPLALCGHAVEIVVTQAREHAGKIAVREMVLTQDALRL